MISLDELVADPAVRAQVSRMLDAPAGIFAVSGADGSGKSTALMALVKELRLRGTSCQVILDDPELEAMFLRGCGLSEGDIRMIPATRDAWREALNSTSTGQVVVTQEINWRNAAATVEAAQRGAALFTLFHSPFMGIDCAYTLQTLGISSADFLRLFSCVTSQMLVAALCPACREPATIDVSEAQTIDPAATGPMNVWKEVGCARCSPSGTKGQIALHEVLVIDDASRPVLGEYLEKNELRNPLPPSHVTLQELARRLVRQGKVGFSTYKRQIAQNPILRMQHQWELERVHGVSAQERLSRLRRFFSPGVADLILSGLDSDPLRTRRREIVVVFLDLRGFTAFAEVSDPEDVMRVLGDYHAAMGELVMQHGGTLERFAGDGMMIFFNDPVQVERPAHDAVAMAVAMQRRFSGVRHGWRKLGIDLSMGVGIAQGYATIGAIGYEGRRDYGAVGVVTNLAARLCGEAGPGQILVSQRVYGAIEDSFAGEPVGPLSLKGFHAPVTAHAIGWESAADSGGR